MKRHTTITSPQTVPRADSPFAVCGQVMVVTSVDRYRRLARELTEASDAVLEIGCSTGKTTTVLARCGARVVAVDSGVECVEQTGSVVAGHPNVSVRRVDARNAQDLISALPEPSLIFVDIGGNAILDTVCAVIRICLRCFSPRVLVVRSAELAALNAMTTVVEPGDRTPLRRVSAGSRAAFAYRCLLDQSKSLKTDNRVYALYRLFWLNTPRTRARVAEMVGDAHPRVQRIARSCIEHWHEPRTSPRT